MQYLSRSRVNLLIITALLLALFAGLYLLASRQEASREDTYFVTPKDSFRISEADQNTAGEEALELDLSGKTGSVIIDKGGRYLLRGDLQGTLYVDTEDQNVHLLLDNVSIVGSGGPAVSVLSAGKVFITSLENTSNSLGDSPVYLAEQTETACIHANTDLTLNGTGELLITGLYEDGIYCRDTLKILSSNLKVQSKRDCLRGNDGVLVRGSNISLEAERNGIRTTNSGPEERGDVEIRDAELSVIAGEYAVIAASDLYVHESACMLKGIRGTHKVSGEVLMGEECLIHE